MKEGDSLVGDGRMKTSNDTERERERERDEAYIGVGPGAGDAPEGGSRCGGPGPRDRPATGHEDRALQRESRKRHDRCAVT